ncbi:hypothetical protein [Dysgonomonas sp. ZJ709]|uniref:hypothetical protein n=1 Tax=Dysgonomonas sp. ZJ709 TaxID=2709797 RepID=UPI0013EABF7C|nr:hypothetical protein [Dysgonomonas sp. ZJ709]
MKKLKYLVFILASIGLFACSSNDDEAGVTPGTGKKKTVTLQLDGIVSQISKSIANKSTAGVITLNDVTILLTDGTNIYEKKTILNSSSDFATITTGSGYVFHQLDPAINKVIVLGNTTGETLNYTNVASVKSSVMQAADEQDKNNILLYGENILTPSTETQPTPHPLDDTDYFTTTVNLSALVSRVEIGKIQCSDLGNTYSSFKLVGLGLVDIYQQINVDGTGVSEKLSIYTGLGSMGKIYEPGLANPPVGLYEFGNAPAIAWAYNAISPIPTLTSGSNSYYAGGDITKVFAHNFIPVAGTFPNVKIRLMDVTRVDNSPTQFSYVATRSFSGAGVDNTHPKPGYIYQFDLVFTESNIGPWDPDSRICIAVNVTVSSWIIQALTPTFY